MQYSIGLYSSCTELYDTGHFNVSCTELYDTGHFNVSCTALLLARTIVETLPREDLVGTDLTVTLQGE
jgi:hypothetical protein